MNFILRYFLPAGIILFCPGVYIFSQNIGIEKLGDQINTEIYQEISPVLSEDGSVLYFTRTGAPDFEKYLKLQNQNLYKKLAEPEYMKVLANIYSQLGDKNVRNPHRSAFNQDVWLARSFDGFRFEYLFHPGPPLNNALPNSISSKMPLKDNFVIINQFPEEGGMQKGFSTIRRISDTIWSAPKPLLIDNYYTKSDIVSFSMSHDGKAAFMSLKRDDSKGENDIYVSMLENDSLWSEPINVEGINSAYNDITPYLSEDMRTLFFASNRPGTTGGLDIFMCTRESATSWHKWSEPKPMIEPINSVKDDLQPHYNAATGYLYFSTRRLGSSDIYRAKIGDPNPVTITILGRAIDSKTLRPVSSSIYIGNSDEDNFKKVILSETGEFTIVARKDEKLKIYPFKEGYLSQAQIIDPSSLAEYGGAAELNIYIDQKSVNGRINLNPIYFIQSKALIQERSIPALQKLVDLLKNNPKIHIRIEGHTDNQGDPGDLQKLSEERAEEVKKYLVKNGILTTRLETRGFGASQPVNNNSTVDMREQNRRVEFIITKI